MCVWLVLLLTLSGLLRVAARLRELSQLTVETQTGSRCRKMFSSNLPGHQLRQSLWQCSFARGSSEKVLGAGSKIAPNFSIWPFIFIVRFDHSPCDPTVTLRGSPSAFYACVDCGRYFHSKQRWKDHVESKVFIFTNIFIVMIVDVIKRSYTHIPPPPPPMMMI